MPARGISFSLREVAVCRAPLYVPRVTESVPPTSRRRTGEEVADYVVELASALDRYGCPSYRVEHAARVVAEIEGFHAEPFVLPTGIFLRLVGEAPHIELHRMVRVAEWTTDLGALVEVDEIFNDVADRKLTLEAARARLRTLPTRPHTYSKPMLFAASVLLAAAAAVFLGGRAIDVPVAAAAGGGVGLVEIWLLRSEARRLLADFVAALLAASAAWLATRLFSHVTPEVIVLAATIGRFPGMTFTNGLAELAQKNLVSGGARLAEAMVTLLQLVLGVALVFGVQQLVHADPTPPEPVPRALPLLVQGAALVVSSLSFGVIFHVPRRFLWTALASGATAYVTTALAVRHLPGHLAAFLAAFAVCLLANALARKTARPAQLFQIPGMMLLVPGSFGFLSLGYFLRGDFVAGASRGFSMLLTGGGLVLGVLLANALLPARKVL